MIRLVKTIRNGEEGNQTTAEIRENMEEERIKEEKARNTK